eukprot:10160095-Alexandrium_andersonii.AAC.1
MSASLVGSEMCIRDRLEPPDSVRNLGPPFGFGAQILVHVMARSGPWWKGNPPEKRAIAWASGF